MPWVDPKRAYKMGLDAQNKQKNNPKEHLQNRFKNVYLRE